MGSPAHPLAGKTLHSHLVGCFTNNETRCHFTLFVPVGHDQCLPVPLEWAPLFTALATIYLYPSLPFLVCTPDYALGTFSAVDDLIACFPRSAAFHAFSSNSSLVRPDVFLRLPPAANFTGQPVEGRPDFVSHTPAVAMTALLEHARQPTSTALRLENRWKQDPSQLTCISPSSVRPIVVTYLKMKPISLR